MSRPLQERLEEARRAYFVGRDVEIMLFKSALEMREPPYVVLYFFGTGGVGKTSLLRELLHIAKEMQVQAVYVDGRDIDPSPASFQETVQRAFNLPESGTIEKDLGENGRIVLLVDTYDLLTPLDGWLRDTFLPKLPDNFLVILASRQPPASAWRSDPGWQTMMRIHPLRNLSNAESRDYLQRRRVPTDQHDAVLSFTHGHALALSLVADATAQQPDAPFQPEKTPDIIRVLLERLTQQVPTPIHRRAIEACAVVRVLTEPLLAAMLQKEEAHDLFVWLRKLSFLDFDERGIFPHDLAREALVADLRWRNQDRYRELHDLARNFYITRVNEGTSHEQRRILSDYIYLHRENATVKPYFEWQATGLVFTDEMEKADLPVLLQMVRTHEGQHSEQLAAHWLAEQPQRVRIFRQAGGQVQGFLLALAIEKVIPEERSLDPAVAAVWRYLQHYPPLRPDETATFFRFWMGRESYQAVTPIQSHIFLSIVQHYLTTYGLAYTFIPCADPDFWTAAFAYADLKRLHEADFEVDGRRYGIYGRDWRTLPPLAWLELMAQQEQGTALTSRFAKDIGVRKVNKKDFKASVWQALRDLHDIPVLQENPLLHSQLIKTATGHDAGLTERAEVLQKLLTETVHNFRNTPRQIKWYRALYHTYFQPAASQEKAAELLGLPFSTYRYHLRQGIEELANRLWQQEV